MKQLAFILVTHCLFFACQEENPKVYSNKEYKLSQPDQIFYLPAELKEISGLAYWRENILAAIQDEKGIIYFYNLASSAIQDKIDFAPAGDYEDLTISGDSIFIIRSDGVIFTYYKGTTKTIKSKLTGENTEGLAFNKDTDRLLIGSKKTGKIYSMDLASQKLSDKAVIDPTWEKNFISGMAFHPNTNDLYVLSDNKLLILDSTGFKKETIFLKSSLFPNPEGITFSKEGDLYISNEGTGNEGTILWFKQRKKN